MPNKEKSITVTLTEQQVQVIYSALRQFTDVIWDDPEVVGIDDDKFDHDDEAEAAIMDYINKNINSIIDEINKQLKK